MDFAVSKYFPDQPHSGLMLTPDQPHSGLYVNTSSHPSGLYVSRHRTKLRSHLKRCGHGMSIRIRIATLREDPVFYLTVLFIWPPNSNLANLVTDFILYFQEHVFKTVWKHTPFWRSAGAKKVCVFKVLNEDIFLEVRNETCS